MRARDEREDKCNMHYTRQCQWGRCKPWHAPFLSYALCLCSTSEPTVSNSFLHTPLTCLTHVKIKKIQPKLGTLHI